MVLGENYSGTLIHDGWSVYDRFEQTRHQQCLARRGRFVVTRSQRSERVESMDTSLKRDRPCRLMRRCHDLLETAVSGAARFPHAVLDVFRTALAARDRFRQSEQTAYGLRVLAGRFTSSMQRLVAPIKTHAANERFAKHLENHLDDLFTFLRAPTVDATNWRAEQDIRPAVVVRRRLTPATRGSLIYSRGSKS